MFRMKKRTGSAGKAVCTLIAALLISGIIIPSTEVEAKTGIKLTPASVTLKAKESKTVALKNGRKKITKGVKFSSSRKKVASVSKKGKITGLKKGSATITALYKGKKYKCKVTVTANKFTDDMILTAVKNYSYSENPDLKSIEEKGEYPVYWTIESSDSKEVVVRLRSYTAALKRFYVDPDSGYVGRVTESPPHQLDVEYETGESFSVSDYL